MKKRMLWIFVGTIFLLPFYIQSGFTQPTDEIRALQKEIEEIKEGQIKIQKDLEAIKSLLSGRRAPRPFQPVVVSVDEDPFKGDKNAKVTLIDFSDYQ